MFVTKRHWAMFGLFCCLSYGMTGIAVAQLFPEEEGARQRVLDLLDNKNPVPPLPEETEEHVADAGAKEEKGHKKNGKNTPAAPVNQERVHVPVYAHNPILGVITAPVMIIEFSDLGCKTCPNLYKPIKAIVDKHPKHIAWVHKHAALNPFGASNLAAFYGKIAQRHNVFWGFRKQIDGLKDQNEATLLKALAKAGLSVHNSRQLIRLYARDAYQELDADTSQNNQLRLQAPPVIMVNGRLLIVHEGQTPAQALGLLVKEELENTGVLPKPEQPKSSPPAPAEMKKGH